MTTCRAFGLTAITLFAGTFAQAQVPYRVKDINPSSQPAFGSNPTLLTPVGNALFFVASDPANGRELWKTDGTPSGSGLVKDVFEGSSSSNPMFLTNVDGTLFFVASSSELWKSDGTAEGTNRLRTFSQVGPLASFSGALFFGADGNLWKSDGTAAGTVLVATIRVGGATSNPGNLTVVGNRLFFTADDGVNGLELWATDGTTGGTALVKDINPGPSGSFPGSLTDVAGTLFFAANEPSAGTELWKSDGTAGGTVRVLDIAPGTTSSGPMKGVVLGGVLYFAASTPAAGFELWRSDGSEAGTVMVRDLRPGTEGASPYDLATVGGVLYFAAVPPSGLGFGAELWRSDGTESGTVLMRDFIGAPTGSNPSGITAGDTLLYYAAEDQVWRTDGTAAGTAKVDVFPGPGVAIPLGLRTLGDTLFFGANDDTGLRLWRTDVSATIRIDLPLTIPASSSPASFVTSNGLAFFVADDGIHGRELWRTDGTETGTAILQDIRPGSASANPIGFAELGGALYFAVIGGQIWRTDGTVAGTYRTTPSTVAAGLPVAVPSRGLLFFCGSDPAHGSELWRTDGTEAGTVLVKDIVPGTGSSSCSNVTDVAGTIFFTASQSATGIELWRTDGTDAGTVLVKDIATGIRASSPANLVNLNGVLIFTATDFVSGREVWRSDGTAEGTVLVKDVRLGSLSASFQSLVTIDNHVYFVADDGVHGSEPWVSDGTAAGTYLLKDIALGSASSFSSSPVFLGDTLVFTALDAGVARLWRTDGTEAGTEVMTDLPTLPNGFFVGGGFLFFAGRDADAGTELWRTDGSPAGTMRVADLVPGDRSSFPFQFGSVGSILLFGAMDDTAGRELWAFDWNRPPAAQAGPDQTVEPGLDVSLDGSASSDADGDPLTYEWRDASGAVFATTATATISDLAPGVYEYTLAVGDGRLTSFDVVRVTVLDPPSIAIGNAEVLEGRRRRPGLAVFEVRLSRPSAFAVSVHYATEDGTARAPRDYVPVAGTLELAPGTISTTVVVTIRGDRRCERDETFFVVLDSAVNGTLATPRGLAAIVNDDCGPHHP